MQFHCDRCLQPFVRGVSYPHPRKKHESVDICTKCCHVVLQAPRDHPDNLWHVTPTTLETYIARLQAENQRLRRQLWTRKSC